MFLNFLPDEAAGAPAPPPVPTTEELTPEREPAPSGAEGEAPSEEAAGEGDWLGQAVEALHQLRESDPDLARRLGEAALGPPEQADEAVIQREREISRRERQAQVGQAAYYALSSAPESIGQQLAAHLGEWQHYLKEQVAKAVEEGDASKMELFEPSQIGGWVAQLAAEARESQSLYEVSQIANALLEALEESPIHRHLTAEDKKAIASAMREATAPRRAGALVKAYLNAALRSAPQERERRQKEKEEKEEKMASGVKNLLEALPAGKTGAGRAPEVKAGDSLEALFAQAEANIQDMKQRRVR